MSQTLLIDADDTLWENNIYFERAIAKFITFLDHREHTPDQVRLILNDVERESIVKHGYGLHSFTHSLVECFEKLSADPVTSELHDRIVGFSHQIADHPIEILSGVPETLQYLGERHRLIMMTKGNPTEQSGKVERSGLKEYFSAIEIGYHVEAQKQQVEQLREENRQLRLTEAQLTDPGRIDKIAKQLGLGEPQPGARSQRRRRAGR